MLSKMIELIAGAGILAAGQVTGSVVRRIRRPKPYKPKPPPEPICGCKHNYALHDPETGACLHQRAERKLIERGDPKTIGTGSNGYYHTVVYQHERWETVNYGCSCRRYSGPTPLPEIYAP
jgi:hypothetical protein